MKITLKELRQIIREAYTDEQKEQMTLKFIKNMLSVAKSSIEQKTVSGAISARAGNPVMPDNDNLGDAKHILSTIQVRVNRSNLSQKMKFIKHYLDRAMSSTSKEEVRDQIDTLLNGLDY